MPVTGHAAAAVGRRVQSLIANRWIRRTLTIGGFATVTWLFSPAGVATAAPDAPLMPNTAPATAPTLASTDSAVVAELRALLDSMQTAATSVTGHSDHVLADGLINSVANALQPLVRPHVDGVVHPVLTSVVHRVAEPVLQLVRVQPSAPAHAAPSVTRAAAHTGSEPASLSPATGTSAPSTSAAGWSPSRRVTSRWTADPTRSPRPVLRATAGDDSAAVPEPGPPVPPGPGEGCGRDVESLGGHSRGGCVSVPSPAWSIRSSVVGDLLADSDGGSVRNPADDPPVSPD